MEQQKKNAKKIIILAVLVVVLCLLAGGAGWFWGKKNVPVPTGNVEQTTPMPTEEAEVSKGQSAQETQPPVEATAEPEEKEAPVTKAPQKTEAPATQIPATEAPATEAPQKDGLSALHVEGAKLCDENGDLVQLRGLSTHGIAWFPQYVNEELFKEFKEEWNANIIRLAMYTAENDGYCTGGNKDDLKQLVKDGVEYATKHDLYVIIDWHILSDGNPNTYKEEAKAFFKEMSELYKDYPNVIYEVCNEPNGGTSWRDVKSYAEEVIGVIRENDEDNIIIVGTPNWSQYVDQAAADPITSYDNIMYALHYYAATHKEDLRKKMVNAYKDGLPIFVTEYGICDASGNGAIDEYQANAWVDEMNNYGISYVAWNISNKSETSAIFKSSCSKSSGFAWDDLSDSGKWLYTMLTGHDGTGVGDMADKGDNQNDLPKETQKPAATEPPKQDPSIVSDGKVEATLELKDSWESSGKTCYNFNMMVNNIGDSTVDGWTVEITFSDNITLNQGWNGVFAVNGKTLVISSVDYNGRMEAGQSVIDIGFIIEGSQGLSVVE